MLQPDAAQRLDRAVHPFVFTQVLQLRREQAAAETLVRIPAGGCGGEHLRCVAAVATRQPPQVRFRERREPLPQVPQQAVETTGGQDAAWRFIDATRLLSITANLGDVRSTITHPASTTHGKLTQEERDEAGIRDSLIRVAVGLEDVADVQDDLLRGLQAARAG